ncbi:MAG: NTP transferase domain-containing protein [Chloroflexota bacterium]|nr:NTP transferase domain-containing protein [Chloroflexota bacterium]
MQERFDAVIVAGYDRNRQVPDPLTAQSGKPHKVLIKIAGQPMIWHVVQALATSQTVSRIVIVGLGPEDGVDFGCPVHYLPNQGTMLDNIVHGYAWLAQTQPRDQYALLLTGDIPLLRGEMVDWFVRACHPLQKDVYWGIVEKQTMEATFPGSKRSYLRTIEGQFCSGDLFLGTIEAALGRQALIQTLIDNRKNIFQQLRLLGLPVLLKFLTRRLRLQDVANVVERALGLRGGPVVLPFAEVGMDVDKPHQLAQVLTYLARNFDATASASQDNAANLPHA